MIKKLTPVIIMLCAAGLLVSCQSQETENNPTDKNKEQTADKDDDETNQAVIQKSNALGFHVMDELEKDSEDNVFISPISMYMALSMIYPAAENETKEQMADVLDVDDMEVDELNHANLSLLESLNEKNNADIDLTIANSIWMDNQFQLNTDYKAIVANNFNGELAAIDGNDQADVEKMNDWVEEQTNGNIDNIAEAPLGDDFVAMLVNTVYFDGKWAYPFDEEETEDGTFHLQDDEETEVPFMNMKEKLNYSKQDDYETVELPYGEDADLGMYLFLPEEDGDLDSIHEAFQDKDVKDILAEMEQIEGKVSLPKFELDYEKEMNDILTELGMEQAFDEKDADLPNMIDSDDPLHISEIKHQTYLDIDETGTEAAGETNAGIETTSLPVGEPFDMKLDHPFVMLIADKETGTVLFAGDIWDVSS